MSKDTVVRDSAAFAAWMERHHVGMDVSCAFGRFVVTLGWKRVHSYSDDKGEHSEVWSLTRQNADLTGAIMAAIEATGYDPKVRQCMEDEPEIRVPDDVLLDPVAAHRWLVHYDGSPHLDGCDNRAAKDRADAYERTTLADLERARLRKQLRDLRALFEDDGRTKALRDLLEFVKSGRRYESKNAYSIPEVIAAHLALGLDRFGDTKE